MDWHNVVIDVVQVPHRGEYIATSSNSHWYQVTTVVHCLFPDSDFVAEVCAFETDSRDVDLVPLNK
jgi:hypothetical protein